MPLALTVDAPAGQLQDTTETSSLLAHKLMKLHCCIETCGWSSNATVIIQRDDMAHKVFRLLMLAGCSIQDGRKLDFEYDPPSERPTQRHLQPWNIARRDEDFQAESAHQALRPITADPKRTFSDTVATTPSREAPVEKLIYETSLFEQTDTSVDTAYQARVEAFILELREILMRKQADPEDLNALLEEARRITANEDPETGPHHGLIILIETALRARATVPQIQATISA